MTFDELRASTLVLKNYYNREFNPEQLKILFKVMQKYPKSQLDDAIKTLCIQSKFMPNVSEIIAIMPKVENVEQPIKYECKLCHGSGIIYQKRQKGRMIYEYAVSCKCKNAINYNGQECAEHKSKYYLASYKEAFKTA